LIFDIDLKITELPTNKRIIAFLTSATQILIFYSSTYFAGNRISASYNIDLNLALKKRVRELPRYCLRILGLISTSFLVSSWNRTSIRSSIFTGNANALQTDRQTHRRTALRSQCHYNAAYRVGQITRGHAFQLITSDMVLGFSLFWAENV